MFVMDVPPDLPAQYAPVMIAQVSQTQAPAPANIDRTIGVCHLVNSTGVESGSDPLSPIYVISPSGTVRSYFKVVEKKFFSYESEIKVTLLQGPEHGILKVKASGDYRYTPEADYIGTDHATLLVEIGGLKVKAVYNFKVIDGGAIGGTEGQDKKNCPRGMYWKISLDANGNQVLTLIDSNALQTDALASSLLNSQVGAGSGVTLNIVDLAGGALGQTTGTSITLETTPPATTGSSTPPPPTTANSSPPPTPTNGLQKRAVPPTAKWTCSPSSFTNTAML